MWSHQARTGPTGQVVGHRGGHAICQVACESCRGTAEELALDISKTACGAGETLHPKIAIQDLGAKGLGIVATASIEQGELLLREAPLLQLPSSLDEVAPETWDSEVQKLLDKCTEEGRNKFWALHDAHADGEESSKSALGVILTNAHATTSPDRQVTEAGLFPLLSRFNHSCRPNLHHAWQRGSGFREVRAIRNIDKGAELCISYIDLCLSRAERQNQLLTRYGFFCQCEACAGVSSDPDSSSTNSTQSDQQRNQLLEIDRVLPLMLGLDSLDENTMEDLVELVSTADDLIAKELNGHSLLRCRLYNDALQIAVAAGQIELAKEFARRASADATIALGPSSVEARSLQRYSKDPLELARDLTQES